MSYASLSYRRTQRRSLALGACLGALSVQATARAQSAADSDAVQQVEVDTVPDRDTERAAAPVAVTGDSTAAAPATPEAQPAPAEARASTTVQAPGSQLAVPPKTEPRADQDASSRVGYEKGFFIASADESFSLHVQGRVQTRFTFESVDQGSEVERTEVANFSVARARLKLHGNAHTKALKYTFQADFGKGTVALKDYFLDYAFLPSAVLRVGQFKRPFSRQQITSSGNQEFVDRSITDKGFAAGRDIGLMLHDSYEKSPDVEYALGLFNGNGDASHFSGQVVVDPTTGEGVVEGGKFSNVPTLFEPALVARLGYNLGGITGYKEVDFEGSSPRLGVGLSGLMEFDADQDDVSHLRAEADYMFKAYGFSSTGGLYVTSMQDGASLGERALQAWGGHIQGGYLVLGVFEPALRYASVQPEGPNNNLQELTLGLSAYFIKHELKWQTDTSLLFAEAVEDKVHYQLRSQLQLVF